jgi:hypothetical protein
LGEKKLLTARQETNGTHRELVFLYNKPKGNHMPLTPQDFVSKWKRAEARERQSVQEHFIDLCALAGHETPMQQDPSGTRFAFEMGAAKTSGGSGWADVAKLGYFGWEYKGKDSDLDKAYEQLLRYRDAL